MSHRSRSGRKSHLPPPTPVTSPPRLEVLLEALAGEPVIAVDTESNSLHAYPEQVCLIQFSVSDGDYVVDTLAGLDLSPLSSVFADPGVEKVFHAAEYDVMCLRRDFDFHFVNLFDTMWAARILGWPRIGLADILKDTFGVHTNKRYQRHNWGKRPLESRALVYAALDTHYLLPLRQLQIEALRQKRRLEEAREIFAQVAASPPMSHTFDPEGFWRVKGAFDMTRRQQAILRELYVWRDREARRQDRPPFKVLHDRMLTDIAGARPHTREQLAAVQGMKRYHVRRYGRPILRAVEQGERTPLPEPPPPPPRHSEEEVSRFEALRTWRKQVAARRGVDVDVVVSNAVCWNLAEQNPDTFKKLSHIEGLGPWKRKMYGKAILNVLDAEA